MDDEFFKFAMAQAIGKTYAPVDRLRNGVLLRGLEGEQKKAVQRLIMDAHRQHLIWRTLVQRKWQTYTRRPSRARHHDSIQIRERWVRCG